MATTPGQAIHTMTDATTPQRDDLFERLAGALAPSYELERELGRGGMAIVYQARDVRLKRRVAVKMLPPDLAFREDIRSRFMREAQTAAGLAHPNIVPIFLVDERDGGRLVYFVMALIDGEGLGERLARVGPLPIAECERILREVGDALGYAHAKGVVHRDIKPDNILLDGATGRAIVTDFGIARATGAGDTRLTATGAALGTPAYMSPEQCAGDREVDGRSDLYSLGAVAYHMIAGVPPFAASNAQSIMMKHVMEHPASLRLRRPDVPAELESVVMRLLEKDPANRFATAQEMIAALDALPAWPGTAVVAAPPESRQSPQSPQREREAQRAGKAERRAQKRRDRELAEERENAAPIAERIRSFRKRMAAGIGTVAFMWGINWATGGGFWWAIFPTIGVVMDLGRKFGNLWSDGVRISDIFANPRALEPAALSVGAAPPAVPLAAPGPYAALRRQAATDIASVRDMVAHMSKADRVAIPEVGPAADALYARIDALADSVERLDAQISADERADLETRIGELERNATGSAEVDRRLSLLLRQRTALEELVPARDRQREQLDSAALLLRNLVLDLVKMRAAGVAAPSQVTSLTQEVVALSREIGYAIEARDEVRRL